jgi:hypothetical protein
MTSHPGQPAIPPSTDHPPNLNYLLSPFASEPVSTILILERVTLATPIDAAEKGKQDSPRLVASSNNVVSTFLAAIFTYRTTEPLMKQFLTAI